MLLFEGKQKLIEQQQTQLTQLETIANLQGQICGLKQLVLNSDLEVRVCELLVL